MNSVTRILRNGRQFDAVRAPLQDGNPIVITGYVTASPGEEAYEKASATLTMVVKLLRGLKQDPFIGQAGIRVEADNVKGEPQLLLPENKQQCVEALANAEKFFIQISAPEETRRFFRHAEATSDIKPAVMDVLRILSAIALSPGLSVSVQPSSARLDFSPRDVIGPVRRSTGFLHRVANGGLHNGAAIHAPSHFTMPAADHDASVSNDNEHPLIRIIRAYEKNTPPPQGQRGMLTQTEKPNVAGIWRHVLLHATPQEPKLTESRISSALQNKRGFTPQELALVARIFDASEADREALAAWNDSVLAPGQHLRR